LIYFSYFNNRKTRALGLERISVALHSFEVGVKVANELCVPKEDFIKYKQGTIDFNMLMLKYYEKVISKLDLDNEYNKYDGKVLLCHEVDICHRRFLMQCFIDAGHECIELPR